ncbi:17447_t:CDS:2 [Funneliformis geosporum]|nr:17447_t:CDS:2 [Funneliformis geosporum]
MTNVPGPQRAKIDGGFTEGGDLLKEMNTVPLFMTEMPEEESDTLAALQTLIYDGPPEEVAENFKNQGNECFKVGKSQYKDAIEYYTKALDTKCKDDKIIEACLTNRAAVNLELENFRKVLTDCSKALKLNSQNIKAYYRSAKALYALDKIEEAIDCCEHGLAVQSNNKALQDEKGRNIKMIRTSKTKALIEKSVRLDKETNNLIWPVIFSYPEYKESDFIESFNEEETFLKHLEVMFERHVPWDKEKKYKAFQLSIYFEYTLPTIGDTLPTTKLLKIGKRCALKEALSHPKCVVKDGIPIFFILSDKGEFKEEFLAKYK